MNHVNLSLDFYSHTWYVNFIIFWASSYRRTTLNTNTPWQHPFQKCVGFLLLFDQLTGSLHNKLLQVVRVLFHHVHDVVKDVRFPVEWTTKQGHFSDATRSQDYSRSSRARDNYSGHNPRVKLQICKVLRLRPRKYYLILSIVKSS